MIYFLCCGIGSKTTTLWYNAVLFIPNPRELWIVSLMGQYSIVAGNVGSGVSAMLTGFESQPNHLQAVCPWQKFRNLFMLNFLKCKMKIIVFASWSWVD